MVRRLPARVEVRSAMFEAESPSCQLFGLHYHRGLTNHRDSGETKVSRFNIPQKEKAVQKRVDYGVNSACCDQDLD